MSNNENSNKDVNVDKDEVVSTFGPEPPKIDDDWETNEPLFMDSLPDDWENNENLAALRASEQEMTPLERAEDYKAQGNEFFKRNDKKYYKIAISFYTKALNENVDDKGKHSIYLTNRSAVNLKLGNYRMVLNDCEEAMEYDSKNIKAYYRASLALFKLRKYDESVDMCNRGLEINKKQKDIRILKKKCEKKLEEIRKKEEVRQKILLEKRELEKYIYDTRKYKMGKAIYPAPPQFKSEKKYQWATEEHDELSFNVQFIYPEHSQSDFVQVFNEDDRFIDHLVQMFPTVNCVPWDVKSQYVFDNLVIYYKSYVTNIIPNNYCDYSNFKIKSPKWISIKDNLYTLRDILSQENYVIPEIPTFHIFVKNSKFLSTFLSDKNN